MKSCDRCPNCGGKMYVTCTRRSGTWTKQYRRCGQCGGRDKSTRRRTRSGELEIPEGAVDGRILAMERALLILESTAERVRRGEADVDAWFAEVRRLLAEDQ
jgi:hypothetical protein